MAVITGTINGLGVNPWPSFDWNWQAGDPILNPLFSTVNSWAGALLGVPVIAAIWYTNSFNTGYLGINTNRVFDRFGEPYNVSLVVRAITPYILRELTCSQLGDNGLFDLDKYQQYSPAYMAAGNLWGYIAYFAAYTTTIMYGILYYRADIVRGFRSLFRGEGNNRTDIHNRLMRAYPEAPEWWYTILLLVALRECFLFLGFRSLSFGAVFGLVGLLAFPTHTSVSCLFFGIAISFVFMVPIGIITAVANVEFGLNVLSEFVGGSAYPGNYLDMLYFKTFGVITCSQAISFASDLKLGHYTKIPPRVMFFAQTVATVLAVFVQIGIIDWQVTGVKDLCQPHQKEKFTCPSTSTFFTAAVVWGTIGPRRSVDARLSELAHKD